MLKNPLKTIKIKCQINKDNEAEIVTLVSDYLDITEGVWEVSLDTYCYKVNSPDFLETVYEVSTSLCTGCELDKSTNEYRTNNTVLGHIHAVRLVNEI